MSIFTQALQQEYGSQDGDQRAVSANPLGTSNMSFADALKAESETPESTIYSLAAAPFIGFNRGVSDIVGMPVDAINWMLKKSHEKIGTPAPSDVPIGGSEFFKKGMGIIGANPDAPEHLPRSSIEKGLQAFSEGAGSALVPAAALETVPAKIASAYPTTMGYARALLGEPTAANAVIGGTGAVGGEIAQSMVPKPWKPYAGMVGGIGGGLVGNLGVTGAKMIPVIARSHLSPEESAKRVAGQAIREAAGTQLETPTETLLPNLNLTAEQATGNKGIAQLGNKIGTPEYNQALEKQRQANLQTVSQAAETGAQKLARDVSSEYNLPPNAKESSSIAARYHLDNLENQSNDTVNMLWDNPDLKKATMYKNKSIDPIIDYVDNLTVARREQLDPKVLSIVDKIKDLPTRDVPLKELQDLRSAALSKGRAAYRAGDNVAGGIHYDLANNIKNVIGEGSNIVFGDTTGRARQAWKDAVDATRQYHDLFNSGYMQSLNQNTDSVTRKIAVDQTFKQMLSGKNANQNIAAAQRASNGAINDHLADYLIGELTNDGQKIVSAKDIDSFLNKRGSSVKMVPGLEDKINSIKDMSVSDQLSQNLRKVADDPEKLANFISTNKNEINAATQGNKADQAYFQMLENSANRVKPIEPDKNTSLDTVKTLQNGNVSDILYGIGSGKIVRTLASEGLLKSIQYHLGFDLGGLTETAAVLGTGFSSELPVFGKGIERATDWALSGGVRDKALQILQEARQDPVLMQKLMAKPDPRMVESAFSEQNKNNMLRAAVQGERRGSEKPGYARGGKVGSQKAVLVKRMMDLAEKAKKEVSKNTEPLLNAPDEAIVKALHVANQAI